MAEKKSNIIYPEVKFRDVLSAFWRGIKPQKWQWFFTALSIVLANVCSVVAPIFYKNFFDVISSASDKAQTATTLVQLILNIAIINGFMWLFYRAGTYLNIMFQSRTIARLKQQSYDYLIEHSYGFFTNNFTGSLVQRVNRFARAFETLTDQINWVVLPIFTRIISIVVVLYFINKWMVLIILAWAFVFLFFNFIFSKWKLKYDIRLAEMDSKTTAYLADTITNQNNISLFSAQKFEFAGYKKVTENQAKMTKFTWSLDFIVEAGQSFLMFLIEFLVFYFAIKYWKDGLISVGVFVMLQVYILVLVDQLWGFTRVIKNFYSAYADSKEMVEIMKLPHEIIDAPLAKELIVREGKIEFKNLTFNFNKTRKVLEDINLTIKPGEKVAIIGPSGAGKTTFVRLLLRFYDATSGQILIDEQDISKVTQESLRKNISMVPQDPVLFHRTLAENIAYGKRNASRAEIERAANLAHCDDFIENLPQGFELNCLVESASAWQLPGQF
jgi:ATP-binding cassette subfamily B protein